MARKQRVKFGSKGLRRHSALDHPNELLGKMMLLGRGKFSPIFNSIGDAAQQIGIANHFTKSRWKHWDGQGKRAGDALEYMALISVILGSGLCHALFICLA